jgi:general secretion pathway protein A
METSAWSDGNAAMYLSFYGLNEKPFATTPDPRFLYLTPGHREALAHLEYGVQENTGFLVLTGEVGTGKTSLLRALLEKLDRNTAVAFIVNSGLPFDGILEYMLEELGVATTGASRARRLLALQRFLIERTCAGQNVVLIVDEAHHLDPDTLEHIRLLSNFETPTHKRLQILLVGQPELKAKLALPELRQLQQRITLRAAISPLSSQSVRPYIRRRLRIAGARDLDIFTERAISRIAAYAGGIPRIVNTVCEHGLLIGYADQRRRLDEDVVERAVRYLEDGAKPRIARPGISWRRWLPNRRFAWVALTPALLGLMALPALRREALGVSHFIAPFFTTLVQSARELLGP